MPNKVQFRRGTDAERGTVVLDSGEPGWTTDTKELYVGDGATYGGILVTGSGGGGGTLCTLSDVNCAGTANGKALTFQNGTWIPETPAGGGDMLKSEYVTGAGTVYNASRLGGDVKGTVQAHNVEASKITSGTIGLARIPAVDDARIPDLDTLSYGGAFATGQIPNLPATKITSGSFNANRIPILPTNRYGSAVLLTGAQSIGGTKTFSDIPILPASDPTADNEAARKAYVDAGGGSGIKFHPYTGDETQLSTVSGAYQELKNFRFIKHGSVVSPSTIRMACELKTTAGSYQVQVIVGGATAITFSGTESAYKLRYADYGLGGAATGVVETRSRLRNLGAGTSYNRLYDAYLKY